MAYTPKKTKLKINYKVAIPLCILLFFVAYFFFNVLRPASEAEKTSFQVCGYSSAKTKERLEKVYADTYQFNDYLFYGESLAVFTNPYDGLSEDNITGKSILLKDVCSDEKMAFVMDKGLDRKMILNRLKLGFYEIYIVDDLKEKRLVSQKEIDELFMTSKSESEGKNNQVRFLANKDILKEYKVQLPQHYSFLEVREERQAKKEYDVIIDPAGSNTDFAISTSLGSEGNGLVESQETYQAAEKLKEQLEAKGLKTLIVRKQDQVINTYGEDGRLAKGYKAKAKYYIRLSFAEGESTVESGADILYSNYSSKILATQIMHDLTVNTELKGSSYYMGAGDEPGVIRSKLMEGKLDGRLAYDSDMWVREAGGKATQAGMYSEDSQKGTAVFAKDNIRGMQGLNVSLGYLSNNGDATYWKDNKDKVIGSLAQSIIKYLDLGE